MNGLRTARNALLILLATLPLQVTEAGEFSAVINGKSYHVGSVENWNENNVGLGIEYEFDTDSRWKTRLMANGFRDSNEDMSYMVGGGLHRNLLQTRALGDFYLDLGINAFLMTRTDVNNNNPFPGALPSVTLGNRYGGFNLTYLPKFAVEKMYDAEMMDQSIRGILFLQFKSEFATQFNCPLRNTSCRQRNKRGKRGGKGNVVNTAHSLVPLA